MKDQLVLDFVAELPTVFNILQNNPEAIVDDTAIERLLNWLEEMCVARNERFFEVSVDFLRSDGIWNHSLTLSFALRFAGLLGQYCIGLNEDLVSIIKKFMHDVTEHGLYTEPSVKFGFFRGLSHLAKEQSWCAYLEGFLKEALSSFSSSYVYVRKSAILFVAHYLHSVVSLDMDLDDFLKCLEAEDEEVLQCLLDCHVKLMEESNEVGLQLLYRTDFIVHVVKQVQYVVSSGVLTSLINLFSLLTSCDQTVQWQRIIKLQDGDVSSYLKDFLSFVKTKDALREQLPLLCDSLLIPSGKSCYFSENWNVHLLKEILSTMPEEMASENRTLVKKRFHSAVVSMCKAGLKVGTDKNCRKPFIEWIDFTICALLATINQMGSPVDERFLIFTNDKKITRSCFQFLKTIVGLNDIEEQAISDIVSCLVTCMSCGTDDTQMVCAALDLSGLLLEKNENSFEIFLQAQHRQNDDDGELFANLLSRKMWDISWEVKDSLVAVLTKMIKSAKKGSKVCEEFLARHKFWCSVEELLDDKESYVRAKAVEFLGELFLCKVLWRVFCEHRSWDDSHLWITVERLFITPERQDDMFTRRSILRVISSFVTNGEFFIQDEDRNGFATPCVTYKSQFLAIINTASIDFDWEVRKLAMEVWTCVVSELSKLNIELVKTIEILFEKDFLSGINNAVCDCEYEVKKVALQCLLLMRTVEISEQVQQLEPDEKKKKTNEIIENENGTLSHCKLNTVSDVESFLNERKDFKWTDFMEELNTANFSCMLEQLEEMDVVVSSDPLSFLHDIISSAKQSEANLLDCY